MSTCTIKFKNEFKSNENIHKKEDGSYYESFIVEHKKTDAADQT